MKDKEIFNLLQKESQRQKRTINLIASENCISKEVAKALSSSAGNKYAEGYPGRRYYGGQEYIDKIEILCQQRALKLFKLNPKKWAVNVQALSGSPANLAVYFGLVPPGGKIMGLSLSSGGHLTHGQKVSATGKFWKQIPYEVDPKTERLDYDYVLKLAKKEKPALIVTGYTAYPRKIDFKKFRQIADEVGAILMVDMSHLAGLVAGGAYPSPFNYADIVTTTTHKTLRGPRSALIFSRLNEKNWPTRIDKAVFPGLQGGPHMNQIAAVAVALKEASLASFKKYAEQVVKNAKVLADELKKLNWRIVSGGTDSHLILVDTWHSGLSGQKASQSLELAGIIVNKNTIPGDSRSPFDPSGVRLGTAFETTRGKKEKDMVAIAKKIDTIWRQALS